MYIIAFNFALISFGSMLNVIAVWSNNNKMPAVKEMFELFPRFSEVSSEHCVMTKETKFKILCDIIPVYFPPFISKIIGYMSIGDIFVIAGQKLILLAIIIQILLLGAGI